MGLSESGAPIDRPTDTTIATKLRLSFAQSLSRERAAGPEPLKGGGPHALSHIVQD